MHDIKFIIENPGLVKRGSKRKGTHVDIDKIVELYEKRNEKLSRLESLRARQNEVSKLIPKAEKDEKEKFLDKMSKVKDETKTLEPEIAAIEIELDQLAIQVPNPPLDSTPDGIEADNKPCKTHGEKPKFDFTPKDHITLGKDLDIIDIERGTRASGTRFYYLKNEAALLEFALLQHVIHKLTSKGFSPVIPPVLVKEEAMFATGFFPADRNEIYHVNPKSEENPENDDLFLVGTSEVPLTMLHYTEILDAKKLPIRYCGFSS